MKTTSIVFSAVLLLGIGSNLLSGGQGKLGNRTTSGSPLSLVFSSDAKGLHFYRGGALAPRTRLGPRTPLEICFPNNQPAKKIDLTTGMTNPICTSPGFCGVAVRYTLKGEAHTIYVVRDAGRLLVVSPDEFKKVSATEDLLSGAAITAIEEADKPPVTATMLDAEFAPNN